MRHRDGFLCSLLAVSALSACQPGVSPPEVPPEAPELVFQDVRVMDPESGLDAVRYVGITDGTIVAISETPIEAPEVVDASGAWAGRLGRSPQERLNLTPMRPAFDKKLISNAYANDPRGAQAQRRAQHRLLRAEVVVHRGHVGSRLAGEVAQRRGRKTTVCKQTFGDVENELFGIACHSRNGSFLNIKR